MLPVVEEDGRSTARRILIYSVALIPISLLPSFMGMAGRIYFVGAVVLGFALLYFGIRLAFLKLASIQRALEDARPSRVAGHGDLPAACYLL